MRNRMIVALALALAVSAAACGGGDEAAGSEPVDVATLDLSADAAAGLATYEAKCRTCHAPDLTGGAGHPLGPGSAAAGKTPAELRGVIAGGAQGMPAWGGLLTDAEIDQLVAFLVEAQGR